MNHNAPLTCCLSLLLLLTVLSVSAAAQMRGATPAAAPPPSRQEMLAQTRDRAIEQVLLSARSDDPFLRANAIEAMQPVPQRALPLAQLGLQDKHPAVRYAALATLGQLKLPGMREAVTALLDDPSPSVRAAAMFAAHELGAEVSINGLARLLQSPDPGVRGNTVLLMGMTGDRSAIPMLQELVQVPMSPRASAAQQALTRIQFAEALIRLGDDHALDAVRAGAYSSHDEVRVLSVMIMGRTGDRRMAPAIRQMLENPPIELQLAAAEALARMGWDDGLPQMLAGAQSSIMPARAQSAFGLALLHDPRATAALITLLDDSAEQVRLSAAAAILKAE